MTQKEKYKKGAALIQACQTIENKARDENRDFTDEDKRLWDQHIADFDALGFAIGSNSESRQEKIVALERWLDEPVGGRGIPTGLARSNRPNTDSWIDAKTGAEVRTLAAGDRLADLVRDTGEPPLSFGKYFRGLVTGNWKGAEAEMRAMSEGTLATGGYMVPSPLAASIIDKARNATAVMAAGAVTIPMDSQTLAIARATGDPTAAWHSEAGTISASDLSFDRVLLTAQTLAAIAQLSVELAEDAANIDQVVSTALAKVLAIELDRAALLGSGTPPEPKGIRNQSGVTIDSTTFTTNGSVISNAAPTGSVGWAWLAKQVSAIWQVNETPNAAIWAPRTGGELDQLVDTTGQPLRPLPSCDKLNKLQTASIPITQTQGSSVDCSSAFVGDFSKLLIGMRTELVLEISRIGNVGATSLFTTLQLGIRAYLRADIAVARPAAFRVVTGIR